MIISFSYKRHLGPRNESAGLSIDITITKGGGFEFVDHAKWPQVSYAKAVKEGANAEFSEMSNESKNGLRVVLVNVDYDYVESCYRAFYLATRAAIEGYFSIIQTPWTEF